MKKILFFLLVLLVSMILFSFCASAETTTFGDTDGNGKINANDALIILRHSVGKTTIPEAEICYADTNTDYAVNATDALNVLKYSVGKIKTFKADTGVKGKIDVPAQQQEPFMQVGATRGVDCFVTSDAESIALVWDADENYINAFWAEEWDGNRQVLMITAQKDPSKTLKLPVRVFLEDAPGIYRTIMVELAPSLGDRTTDYNFGTPVLDFGDYTYTPPAYANYLFFEDYEGLVLRYSYATLDDTLADADECYDAYLNTLVTYYGFTNEGVYDGEDILLSSSETVQIEAKMYTDDNGNKWIRFEFWFI